MPPKTTKVHYNASDESLADVLHAHTIAKWEAGPQEEVLNLHHYSGHVEFRDPHTGLTEWVMGTWQDMAAGCLAFFRDVLGFEPKPYQEDIVRRICRKKRLCVRAPRGAGKSAVVACLIIWFAVIHKECKIPTTAGSWKQLEEYLWPEIRKWAKQGDWTLLPSQDKPELNTLTFEVGGDRNRRAFAVSTDQPELIEGAHAKAVLIVFDEAKAIEEAIFDAAEGTLARGNKWAIIISTPGAPVGRFYEIQSCRQGLEDWDVKHVTFEEVCEGITDPEELAQYIAWAEMRRRQWGEDSPMYRNHVLGEFADTADDHVIPLTWLEMAHRRWESWRDAGFPTEETDIRKLGVDVAGQGKDKTCIAKRVGYRIREIIYQTKKTAPQVISLMFKHGLQYPRINVENDGMGAPIVQVAQSYLRGTDDGGEENYKAAREAGVRVIPITSGSKTDVKDISGELGFMNKRSYMWWNLRQLLDPSSGYELCIPPDPMLTGDLLMPKWTLEGDKIKVEKKEDIKKRLPQGRSTDAADSVIISLYDKSTPVVTTQIKVEVSVGKGRTETFYNPQNRWPGYGGRRW